jgi:hypothetical protein
MMEGPMQPPAPYGQQPNNWNAGQPHYYLPPGMMPPAPTDTKATISLVLGIVSLTTMCFCITGILGIPAVVLGILSRRSIKQSEGGLGGGGMAVAGIVTGLFGSGIFLAWIAFYVVMIVTSATVGAHPPPPAAYPTAPTVTAPSAPYGPPGGYGSIHVVDLRPGAGSLRTQLDAEYRSARAAGEILLIETTATWCPSCREIAVAMGDAQMQAALDNVRLVRIDVDAFGSELKAAGMYEATIPWFYLIDGTLAPRHKLSGDAWGDNTAANIAPVLGAFVKRTLPPAPKGTAL